jgi:hypothetical protein
VKLDEACKQGFGLHQTFAPRFGWLKKAFDKASENSKVFSKSDATVELGVGKNMVDAIAFWAVAFRILDTSSDSKKNASVYQPTEFGRLLFSDKQGLDPFLESPQSLWFLHWMAMRPISRLPVWWLSFAMFSQTEFNSEDLWQFVIEQTSDRWDYDKEKPIQKDLDCMLRMYSPRVVKAKASLDDYLDSPFRDLGLIVPSSISSRERNSYRFQIGEKPGLTPSMVLLACLDYMNICKVSSLTAPRLATDIGSPGRVFRLGETALNEFLRKSVQDIDGVSLESPAGVSQLVLKKPVHEIMREAIQVMYSSGEIEVAIEKVFPLVISRNVPHVEDLATKPITKSPRKTTQAPRGATRQKAGKK